MPMNMISIITYKSLLVYQIWYKSTRTILNIVNVVPEYGVYSCVSHSTKILTVISNPFLLKKKKSKNKNVHSYVGVLSLS